MNIDEAFQKHVQAIQAFEPGTELWAPELGRLLSSVEYLRQAVAVALIEAEAHGETQALTVVLETAGPEAAQVVKARLGAELLSGRTIR